MGPYLCGLDNQLIRTCVVAPEIMGVYLSIYRYIEIFTQVFRDMPLTRSTLIVTAYLLCCKCYLTRYSFFWDPTGSTNNYKLYTNLQDNLFL